MRKFAKAISIFSLVLLLTIIPSIVTIAQDNSTATSPIQQEMTSKNKIDGVPVILDGQTLFLIRRGVGSFSAEDRAKAITDRIEKIAQDNGLNMDDLKIINQPNDDSTFITLGDQVILTINPEDAKTYRASQEELATTALESIENGIREYRKSRTPAELIQGAIYSILATFILLAILFFMAKMSGHGFPRLSHWIESHLPDIKIQNFHLISSHQISNFCLRIIQLIRFIIALFFVYTYAAFVFSLFPWTKAFGDQILNHFWQTLEFTFRSIAQYLPNILMIVVIISITYYLLKFIKPFFNAIEREELVIQGFYKDWAEPTYKLILILIIALAGVVAFPYLPGFNSPAFRGISVFLGILFSLGSTSAVANVVGGIILIYTRAFQIGDRIQIGEVEGEVIEKTLLVTRVRTLTNKIITIPNSSLLNTNVINFSVSLRELDSPLIIQTTLTLGYDLPWQKVHKTFIEAALSTENILKEPAPFVLQTSLDDFYVSYQLNAYIDQPIKLVFITSELHQNLQDKCAEVGIEIMSPHYRAVRDGSQSTIPQP